MWCIIAKLSVYFVSFEAVIYLCSESKDCRVIVNWFQGTTFSVMDGIRLTAQQKESAGYHLQCS